jgi:ribosomal-protein-alanine N-acetyltransferase
MTFSIRWLLPTDLNALVAIDRACFGESAWGRSTFEAFLDEIGHYGLVAAPRDKIVAYLLYGIDPPRSRGAILRLAVRPRQQRRGIGTALVRRLLDRMEDISIGTVAAIAPDSWLAYHLFLQASGFRAVRVHRRLFGTDDGYLFVRTAVPAP